jgi:hypothetical protein
MIPVRRYAGRWGAYVTGGIAILAFLAIAGWFSYPRYPNPPSRDTSRAPNHAYKAGGSGCRPDRLRLIREATKAAHERDRCDEAEQEEERNQESANETRYLSDITEQTLSVARYQGWAFYWQALATVAAFIAASIAAVFAGQAATAANRTFRHQRWTTEREMRPYIFVYEFYLVKSPKLNSPHKIDVSHNVKRPLKRTVYGEWKNSGNTPAKNISLSVRAALFRKGDQIPINDFGPFTFKGPIEPKGFFGHEIEVESWAEHYDMRKILSVGRHEIHVWGKVIYEDEFGKGRWTTFHFYTGGDMGYDRDLNAIEPGNDYR